MLDLFRDYSFWTVVLGTLVLALASSIVGTVTVLTKQSLIGDMLGHASYPGVILAYMLFQTRHPLVLLLGAMGSGYLSYRLVYWIAKHRRQSLANALTLVSASFLGIGILLKQFIQGHEVFSKSAQAGLQTYLFGQAAFIKRGDVVLIILVSSLCLLLYALYYRSFFLYLFDPVFADLSGVSLKILEGLTRLMMLALIGVGLKVVGAVLMSAFLIVPASFGLLWTRDYAGALRQSSLLAGVSALLGSIGSSLVSGLSTGPSIIVSMMLLVGGRSLLFKLGRRKNSV